MTQRLSWQFDLSISAQVELLCPAQPKLALIAFHGYAQSPTTLLAALEAAGIAEDCLLVAPWGPHQFYDRQREVVASWMTRFARDARIEELRQHARSLWGEIERRHGKLPLALFGFSQGAANVYRVGLLPELPVQALYVLAGDMPPEIAANLATAARRPLHLLWGAQDEMVPPARMEADAQRLEAAGFVLQRTIAAGGHGLLPELLAELARGLRQLPRIDSRQQP